MIDDFLFCLVWVEEKYWRFWLVFFFFFFFSCCGLLVVMVVVVGVADGRGGCDLCCGCFLGSGIYYFIVLKAKIDLLLQHIYR